jgi:predicted NAD/FAD-binding protein
VGAGIAGVSAAYHLRGQADVTIFEGAGRIGGHAHTVEVEDEGRTLGLDTAFIVYNDEHYPRIAKFFDDLGVSAWEHPGKFSFFDLTSDSSYVSDDFDLCESEVRAKYDADFVQLWREANRFYTESPKDFLRRKAELPLGEYLRRNGYSDAFRYGFVVLISTAAWSVPADRIWEMPASTVIAFFLAHGSEGLGGRTVPWRTVAGGSISYLRAVQAEFDRAGFRTRLNTPVRQVHQQDGGVRLVTEAGEERFDQAVLATHADDSLSMLAQPQRWSRQLELITYHPTVATLHTDPAVMSPDRTSWRSWNYGRRGYGPSQRSWVVYYLNRLQNFTSETDYFVTLDSKVDIRQARVIKEIHYRHPVFTIEARRIQREIYSLNQDDSPVKFAGSYFHSRKMGPDIVGSHESGFDSGMAAAESVMRTARLPVPRG